MIDPRYSYASLAAADDPAPLIGELAGVLTTRLLVARDPEVEAMHVIRDLQQLGYELHSFDASTDVQTWCGHWGPDPPQPRPTHELVVTMHYPDPLVPGATGPEPEVTLTFVRRGQCATTTL